MSTLQQTVTIRNKLGLHARAATKLAKLVHQFEAEVKVLSDGKAYDASSVMCLLLLAGSQGKQFEIVADGVDAEQALSAITALVEARFDEDC